MGETTELKHYGKLGMKWYQNIFSKPSSTSVKTARRALADKSEFDKLSTKELQDLVARVGLESSLRITLAKNAKENQTIVSKALQSISGMAVKAATDVAKPIVTEFVKNQVASFLKGKGPGVDEVKEEAKKVVNEVTKAAKGAKGADISKSTSQLWNDIKKLSNDGNIFGVSAETARLLSEMKKK